jgi:hypothetical protein
MSSEILYTMILEYGGGTYISQTSGGSLSSALKNWASALGENELATWGLSRVDLFEIAEDDPVLLEGCVSTWCITGLSSSEHLIVVNIVATLP